MEQIEKSQIIKVIFRDITQEETEKIRQEEMKILEEKKIARQKKEEEARKKHLEEIRLKKAEEENKKMTKLAPTGSFNTSYNFYSPNDKVISLANRSADCTPFKQKSQWYILFGSIPINKINTENLFETNGQYRISVRATLGDTVLSVFLRLVTSISVKTVFIENCKSENVIVLQKDELDLLLEKQKDALKEDLKTEQQEEEEKFKNIKR